jgi:hypothetical protein
MQWPVNPNIVQINQFFDILPQCASEVYSIAGYPEYSPDPRTLEPDQQKVLQDLAQKIVDSWKTKSPYVAFLVVGHADVALKIPEGPKRTEFEQDVSEKRAEAARQSLLKLIQAKAGNQDISAVTTRGRGDGSRQRQVRPTPAHPLLTESEMKMNRRVEIFPVRCLLPDPAKRDPNDTTEKRIQRALALVKARGLPGAPEHRAKRAPCVLNKLLKSGVVDTFVDGKSTSINGVGRFRVIANEGGRPCFLPEWQGNYDTEANPLSETEVQKFLARVLPIVEAGGFAPSQSDDHVLLILNEVLERIDMGINQVDRYVSLNSAWVNPVTGYGYSGDAVRRRLQKMYRDHLDDDNNIYSCYK